VQGTIAGRTDHLPPHSMSRAPQRLVFHEAIELQAKAARQAHEVEDEPSVGFTFSGLGVAGRIDPVLDVGEAVFLKEINDVHDHFRLRWVRRLRDSDSRRVQTTFPVGSRISTKTYPNFEKDLERVYIDASYQ